MKRTHARRSGRRILPRGPTHGRRTVRIHDISIGLTPDVPVWPGESPILLQRLKSISHGNSSNVSALNGGVHTGTHVDAPFHFLEGGATVEALSLNALVGRARVVEVTAKRTIGPKELDAASIPAGTLRLLLKTSNSKLWVKSPSKFDRDFVALSPEGAEWVVERGMRLIGIDYLSIEPFSAREPVVHKTLLGAEVVVVEGLNLTGITPGSYDLVCLPLKLVGSDGAPARTILISR